MSINLRKRGQIYYARGTVRIGKHVIQVPQFSTGCHLKSEAEQIVAEHEARIRGEHREGPQARQKRLTLDDCFAAYLTRPGGVTAYDNDRIQDLSDRIGTRPIAEAPEAWTAWLSMRATGMAPSTINRWRAVYRAAIATGCKTHAAGPPPEIPMQRISTDERLVYLTGGVREQLLAAYTQNAQDVMIMLAYQGVRTQEALRLDWRYVDMDRRTIYVAHEGRGSPNARTKSGRGRSLPMHSRTHAMLEAMLRRQKRVNDAGEIIKPDIGAVFLSIRKKPYADTRGLGGNPLRRAHESACRKTQLNDFRVHDWRHDWAARCVMAGMDLVTLMKLGGWSSLRMVEKYASVNSDHMRDALNRIA